ncbi:hypothetical protein CEXT_35471 [Caerostris extrusa]|uniref:Uncharacterized protein n=1 Tax=Caerostris extrusa TaxID=172846 RepID=A0AAV4UHG1_CAEEX|nr:hypothetical protein CEXT_35471 [Caerostris extrusa]
MTKRCVCKQEMIFAFGVGRREREDQEQEDGDVPLQGMRCPIDSDGKGGRGEGTNLDSKILFPKLTVLAQIPELVEFRFPAYSEERAKRN